MKGEPGNPHRPEDVERKFFDLMNPVWGAERSRKLYDAVFALESESDMGEFGRDFSL
ncbi:MAG: hypothetical protein ACREUX_21715 [Burkholderiales bacterium]